MSYILIVEDERDLAEFISRALEVHGYEVRHVQTAGEAREAIVSGNPMLLIADFSLPDGFGSDLALELRSHCAECPVILMSAFALDEIAMTQFRAATVFLAKPFEAIELLAAVRSALQASGQDTPPV